jgi:hypothetical protein
MAGPAASKISSPALPWNSRSIGEERGLLLLTLVFVPLVCLAPAVLRHRTLEAAAPQGEPGEASGGQWTVRLLPGSQVRIDSGRASGPFGRSVEPEAVRRNMGVMALIHPDRAAELSAALAAAHVLALGYEEGTGKLRFLALDEAMTAHLARTPARVSAQAVVPGQEPMWWTLIAGLPERKAGGP